MEATARAMRTRSGPKRARQRSLSSFPAESETRAGGWRRKRGASASVSQSDLAATVAAQLLLPMRVRMT